MFFERVYNIFPIFLDRQYSNKSTKSMGSLTLTPPQKKKKKFLMWEGAIPSHPLSRLLRPLAGHPPPPT